MTDNEALHILGQAVMTASELLIPVLAVALVVGVAISLLQAVTQVQEMTLTFVPKLAGITLVLLVMGHWMMTQLVDFTRELFLDIRTWLPDDMAQADAMNIDTTVVEAFLLALARSSAWVLSMPLLGSRGVSAVGRLAVAIGLALFIAEPVPRSAEMPTTALGLAASVLLQVGVGLLLGWLVSLAVSAFRVSGVLIDYMSGFGSGTLFDPVSGNLSAVFARFTEAAFTLLLFVTPAWHALVRGFLTSFDALPVGGAPQFDEGFVDMVASTVGTMLMAAVQIGAPVLGALFLTEAALTLAARFVPQANIFLVGLPLKALVAFSTVGSLLIFYPHYVDSLVDLGVELGGASVREQPPAVIKVAAIDESELVLHGLRAVLRPEAGIELVLTATSFAEAGEELRRLGVHGVVFAAGTSRRDTIERCEELRPAIGPQPFLCLLSPTPDEQLLLDVTHVGVRGFLVRDIPASTVASAIRYLAGGECYVDPGLAATLFELVRAEPDEALERLASTERAILARLGEGLTNAEIAQHVFLSEKTVRNYISRLLRKLDLSCRAEAVSLGRAWRSSRSR